MRNLIVGLARPLLRLLGRDERGGVAVLVAVLISGGVLLGIGALVIDVGQIYQNRAELQSGAEAGALAVARSCITSTCAPGAAGQYANSNASALTGHLAAVTEVCGREASGTLVACPTSTGTGGITDCPPIPASGSYVDVHTATLTPTGTVLPPAFSRMLLGNRAYSGARVAACARVQWGNASEGNSLAMTISLCAWQQLADTDGDGDTSSDTDNDNDTKFGQKIPLYIQGGGANTCVGSPSGSNLPGGFAWLSTDTDNDGEHNADTDNDGDASNSCNAFINVISNPPQTYTNTGANISAACQTALVNDVTSYMNGNPVTVFLPVFNSTSGNGQGGTFTVVGLAGFVVTGFSHMNFNPNHLGDFALCGAASNGKCIEGYFMPGLDPVGPINSGGGNFGATAVQITG